MDIPEEHLRYTYGTEEEARRIYAEALANDDQEAMAGLVLGHHRLIAKIAHQYSEYAMSEPDVLYTDIVMRLYKHLNVWHSRWHEIPQYTLAQYVSRRGSAVASAMRTYWKAQKRDAWEMSLEFKVKGNGKVDAVFGELIEDESANVSDDDDTLMYRMLGTLDERRRLIVEHVLGLPDADGNEREKLTLEEIGERLDISRERVRQLYRDALDKLRIQADTVCPWEIEREGRKEPKKRMTFAMPKAPRQAKTRT